MSRRFQFSLRTLLVATLTLCAVLGGYSTYKRHFANYVVLESAKVGNPVRVKGQFFQRPIRLSFWVRVVHHGPNGTDVVQEKGRAERTGLGTYRFNFQFSKPRHTIVPHFVQPGDVDLYLTPLEGEEVAGHGRVVP